MRRILFAAAMIALISGCASTPCGVCPPEDQYITTERGILELPKGFITDGKALTREEMEALVDSARRKYQRERGY